MKCTWQKDKDDCCREAITGQLYCETHFAAEVASGEVGFALMVRKTPTEDEKRGRGKEGRGNP